MINKLRKLDLVIASVITVLTIVAMAVGAVKTDGWLAVLLSAFIGSLAYVLWEGIVFAISFAAVGLQNHIDQVLYEDEVDSCDEYEDDYDEDEYIA